MDGSQSLYCGMPGQGKTWLAVHHAKKSGLPTLAVDSVARMEWPVKIVKDPVEAAVRVLVYKESVRWRPRSRKELDVLCGQVIDRAIPMQFIVDEVAQWVMPNWAPVNVDTLIRTARPIGVHFRATTQDPTGFTRRLRSCILHAYAFRLEDDQALAWIEMWFRGRLEEIKKLKKRKYLEWHI